MTVIAVKDWVMAADGVESSTHLYYPMAWKKITRAPDGSLVGIGGPNIDAYAVHQWVLNGMDFTRPPRISSKPDDEGPVVFVWLKLDGSLWVFDCTLNGYPVASPIYSIGSQTAVTFVEGAMFAGASAEQAVRLACEHVEYINGPVQVERLRAPKVVRRVEVAPLTPEPYEKILERAAGKL